MNPRSVIEATTIESPSKVWKSYDGQMVSDPLFSGSYEQCVDWIRKQRRLKGAWAYDITYPSGRLASYVL